MTNVEKNKDLFAPPFCETVETFIAPIPTFKLNTANSLRIADSVYVDAEKMLKKYSKQLKKVAEALLEYETLDGKQIQDLCKGLNISIKKSDNDDSTPKAKKPKKRAGIPSTTAKQTIVTNEIDNS